jgi:uncharacterized protein (DUF302 family)
MKTREEAGITMRLRVVGVGAVLALVSTGLIGAQTATDRIDVQSRKSFKATVDGLTKALKQKGMMVVATIDHQNMLRMVGASIKGSKTIEFGKPDMGKMLLPMSPDVGLEMPGKFYVWENADRTTVVSYRRVAPLYASYGNEKIAEAGKMMDMMAEKLMRAATQ